MLKSVKEINLYFRTATRAEVDILLSKIILSDRQSKIFDFYYLKKLDVCFIADTLGVCERVVKHELSEIRLKIIKVLD